MDKGVACWLKLGILFVNFITSTGVFKDLVFAVERSSNFSDKEFSDTIEFVYNVTNVLTIGPNDTLVSLVTFSSSVRVEFALQDNINKTNLLTSIEALKRIPREGEVYMPLAFHIIKEYVLQENHGARNGANKIIIALIKSVIDGSSIELIKKLVANNVDVIFLSNDSTVSSWRTGQALTRNTSARYLENPDVSELLCLLNPDLSCIVDNNINATDNERFENPREAFTSEGSHVISAILENKSTSGGKSAIVLVTVLVVIGSATSLVFVFLWIKNFWISHKCRKLATGYDEPTDAGHDCRGDVHVSMVA